MCLCILNIGFLFLRFIFCLNIFFYFFYSILLYFMLFYLASERAKEVSGMSNAA